MEIVIIVQQIDFQIWDSQWYTCFDFHLWNPKQYLLTAYRRGQYLGVWENEPEVQIIDF